jgi:hypothetical protein
MRCNRAPHQELNTVPPLNAKLEPTLLVPASPYSAAARSISKRQMDRDPSAPTR